MRLLIATMLFLVPLTMTAQDAPRKGPPAPRNLKILKPEEIRPVMGMFVQGLGVRCDYCHVQDRASDENPKKLVARTMLEMVHDINTKLNAEAGKAKVTCYTCHRGAAIPLTAPAPAAPGQ